jgi:hypothetical protein
MLVSLSFFLIITPNILDNTNHLSRIKMSTATINTENVMQHYMYIYLYTLLILCLDPSPRVGDEGLIAARFLPRLIKKAGEK